MQWDEDKPFYTAHRQLFIGKAKAKLSHLALTSPMCEGETGDKSTVSTTIKLRRPVDTTNA